MGLIACITASKWSSKALSRIGARIVTRLRAMGHDLIKLWKEFKGRAGDGDLNKFDEVISALNEFEGIRDPDAVVKSGIVVLYTLNRVMSGAVSSPRPLPPQCNLYLQEIDELVRFYTGWNHPRFLHWGTKRRC
jgi:hypothetical protein